MMKKVIAIAFLFTVFLSCEVTDNGGGQCPDDFPFFDINGLTINNRLFETSCCGDVLANNARIELERFSIFGDYEFTLHAHQPSKGGFFSSAYALSCLAGGYEGSKETISEFTVTTNFDFNENFVAGDTINDLFTFNDFITERTLNELLEDEERAILSPQFFLQLMEKPTATDTASFQVNIVLDNGENYTGTTANVIFE